MTVITIVLIAIVLVVGTVIVNNVMKNTAKSGACQTAGGVWKSGKCCTDSICGSTLTCTESGGEWSCVG